jgi:rubrerythrin
VSDPDADRALVAELRRALTAEIGARALYARLAGRMRDPELKSVLASLRDDEGVLVDEVRALLLALGARRAPRSSPTRALTSWILALGSRGRRASIAVRFAHDAECTFARRYHDLSIRFAARGEIEPARACDRFAQEKQRHARVLEAWIAC